VHVTRRGERKRSFTSQINAPAPDNSVQFEPHLNEWHPSRAQVDKKINKLTNQTQVLHQNETWVCILQMSHCSKDAADHFLANGDLSRR